ncbi:hypothetical protein MBM09_12205 [Flaviramulus sp. BrNp1-15]|uniref:hypothetical protein n=1 Tax=Flaviramulus sp. BrNp1-15 TaxID=2916754 RepID=UPI001EE7B79A|nr:hypothetical protein [Flaviramulus sp. BrNp1-15]ULC58675.1 hypothetical protein MBM09_12205 [Flaviramulus sp. BrNp1-15]
MKTLKNSILISVLFLILSCGNTKSVVKPIETSKKETQGVSFTGGSGLSIEDAVIIKAKNSMEGIPAEYNYIGKLHGRRGLDWRLVQQSLQHQGKKSYDIIHIQLTSDKKELIYYFDITSFFGKF